MERIRDNLTVWIILIFILSVITAVPWNYGLAQDKQAEPDTPPQEKIQDETSGKKQADETKDNSKAKDEQAKEPGAAEGKEKNDGEKKEIKPKFTKEQIEKAYPIGERLTYDVSWKGIHAGTAVVEVVDKIKYKGRDCFRIRSYTKSAKAISLVYKVDDKLQTYIDAQTLEPLRSDKRLREGSHKRDEYIIYTPSERTAEYYKKKYGKFVLRRKHVKVPVGIQGALSAIYFLRTMNLENGKSYEVKILAGKRVSTGQFEITKRKKIRIRGVGTYIGLRISPKYIEIPGEGKLEPGEGLFVASGDSEIWVDEATGIPLKMFVDIPVGSITVELSKKETIKSKKK